MATNDFLPWALSGGSNLMDQAAFAASPDRTAGVSSGTADEKIFNKVQRQSAFMGSVVAGYIVQKTNSNMLDDGDLSGKITLFGTAINAAISAALNGYATQSWTNSAINTALVPYAPNNSPALTGAPTAPTQPTDDYSTKIATTAFVDNKISNRTPVILEKGSVSPTSALLQFNLAPYNTYKRLELIIEGLIVTGDTPNVALRFGTASGTILSAGYAWTRAYFYGTTPTGSNGVSDNMVRVATAAGGTPTYCAQTYRIELSGFNTSGFAVVHSFATFINQQTMSVLTDETWGTNATGNMTRLQVFALSATGGATPTVSAGTYTLIGYP